MQKKESKSFAVYEPSNPPHFKPWVFELDTLAAEDVEIKVTHCGICHSDIHTVNGDWGTKLWPCVPGHEIVGYVTQVGSNVKKVKPGDRVGVGPQALSCGKCDDCLRHQEQYCTQWTGTYAAKKPNGYVTKGGYAEFHRVNDRFCVPIPSGLPSDAAAPLLCAGVTVWSPLKHFKVGPNSKVAVVGIGGLGHLGIQFAAKLGAEVTAISTSPTKEAEAKSFGAKHFINSNNEEQMNAAKRSFNFILSTVSAPLDWNKLCSLLAVDGSICNVGAPPNSISILPSTLFMKRISISGSLIGSPQDIEDMLIFAEKHKVLPAIERAPFDKVNESIARVEANQARYRIVLEIDPSYKPTPSL